jgi:hypothetical protein
MMDDSINNRDNDITIEEHSPVGKLLMGRQDDSPVFIQGINQMKQVVHTIFVLGRSIHSPAFSKG